MFEQDTYFKTPHRILLEMSEGKRYRQAEEETLDTIIQEYKKRHIQSFIEAEIE